jgi:hypothetical protein
VAPPTARFQVAFDSDTLDPDPDWTDMDDEIRISEYTIDRGRSFELDRVDTGRAEITINDTDGLLDPTNPGSDFAGDIQPLKQARLAVWDPVVEDWYTRYKGFVESYEYVYHPSQRVNTVTIGLVDIFEIVAAVEMFPGAFGDTIPDENMEQLGGNVFFEDTADGDVHGMQRRIVDIIGDSSHSTAALGSVGLPTAFYDVFSGNVSLHEQTYSAGESAMTAVQEAVDAEFPGVGNVYCDRLGRLCVHGRLARFDPVGTAAATDWDFHDWKAGDGAAVNASPTDTAHIRGFAMSRDLSKIINLAYASPKTLLTGSQYDNAVAGNTVQPSDGGTSKGLYGIRPWSTEGLLTKEGVTDGLVGELGAANLSGWKETRTFADYYARNYAGPQNRVTQITFRSASLVATGAAANWAFLASCDISDRVAIVIGSPGGGGITYDGAHPNHNRFFIEGIHEEHRPLNDRMDDVTMTLDLSPFLYYEDNPYA